MAPPTTSEIAHPPLPRATVRRGTFFSITSRPAKKNRTARPKFSRNVRYASGVAQPST
jgi:hypothetical protein